LQRRKCEAEDGTLIFRDRLGKHIGEVSAAFARVVDRIDLNAGIEDPRRKVCFHTLRHTYGSWLVESGVDIYTVKELLGHKTLAMTIRYCHIGENTLRQATRTLAAVLEARMSPVVEIKNIAKG
jgi:site-specific recombinase XerD